jgi:hypothetical protein
VSSKPGTAHLRKSADSRELSEALLRLCGFAGDPDAEPLYQ